MRTEQLRRTGSYRNHHGVPISKQPAGLWLERLWVIRGDSLGIQVASRIARKISHLPPVSSQKYPCIAAYADPPHVEHD
ncbi:hypothetical protein BOTBODRAFT_554066 [Botryobasidium botryosum FD-172 SS1]|uniref:Uncharacterized protein n=1 Tax=Botryobasidium botryosum (strain FD-172 SS1) TaxID=930990 RepID=A0A067MRL5_BOTB1|nr:hypothetical protein BOTBODRAFT_554066 [Botryobasidium botryosum FD-172 SS1]